MYIDKDKFGEFSIQAMSESEMKLLRAALWSFAKCNFGHIDKMTAARLWKFDCEFKNMLKDDG